MRVVVVVDDVVYCCVVDLVGIEVYVCVVG